ncbi:MAG: hypothetical protein EU531_00690 [Promethearchaeota archaeon]|nr:MAG: hypothetical protein EU531_00690 [Candidatus Lokiarchaeota archaeon]
MERQREKPKEVTKEKKEQPEKELEDLRKELARLKELKKQKELERKKEAESRVEGEEEIEKGYSNSKSQEIEARLDKIEDFLTSKLGEVDLKAYEQNAEEVEQELILIEREIVGEKGVISKEVSTYELLVNDYPWLEEKRYIFMYTLPNKKTDLKDFESWKNEWSKILFDYARYAILHILYLRQLESEKPFSKFEDRTEALKEIAEELVEREQAEWLSKSKEKLRVYWKSLDNWAQEIYEWVIEISPLEPILIFEIRESNKEFSNLPKDDIIKIFKLLEKDKKGEIIKADNGQISFKIRVE